MKESRSNIPFLKQIAQHIYQKHSDNLDAVTLVFPNRRAGLFFRKHLAEELEIPIWSPTILSMEDFVRQYSSVKTADKFSLIAELYEVYKKYLGSAERFDQFYYWGEMLLADFDDIDKYLIEAKYLFIDISKQKELEDYFDYLTEEQRAIILEFWSTFSEQTSEEKEKFQLIWNKLYSIYSDFTDNLHHKNIGYTGLVYKQVAEDLPSPETMRPIVFAGFNALTTAEEKIITHFVNEGAEIYWDVDAFYMQDERQEAGSFLREYKQRNVFAESLKPPYPDNFNNYKEPIHLYSVAQRAGQVKQLGHLINSLSKEKEFNPEKTVIVLPDESLLFPVLNSLPSNLDKLNVTMGYPLVSTPIYSLLEHLLTMQVQVQKLKNGVSFYFKHVLNVLSHPLIQQFAGDEARMLILEIEDKNGIRIHSEQLASENGLMNTIFTYAVSSREIIEYLQKVIGQVSESEEISLLEKEYAYHFYVQLNRISEVIEQFNLQLELEAFIRLFKQVVRSLKLPFTGEPLNGLQVMGVLETRNLDFDNVFILSMNEGAFPAPGKGHSFVPYNIRKAYTLPTFDQQDAIYAYLFYRLLQKAKNVHLFYDTEGGATGGGELSRYVQQIQHESKRKVVSKTLAHNVAIAQTEAISIEKSEDVLEKLNKYTVRHGKDEIINRLTPSAINIYLDCRLKFYFRYVAELYEVNKMQDSIDPMVFGNLLHNSMENLYQPYNREGGVELLKEDLDKIKLRIAESVDRAFASHYSFSNKGVDLEGKQILAYEIINKYVTQIVKLDKQYAPFQIVGLEAKDYNLDIEIEGLEGKITVGLKGIIDRIDKKGERIRIIDYKTGQDDRKITSIESLFDRDDAKRNKAGMQTLLYALLFLRNRMDFKGAVIPGIFNTKKVFSKDFDYRLILEKEPIVNVKPFIAEFEGYLKDVLAEIYSPYIPFNQTNDEKKCEHCPYIEICGR